MKSYVYLQPAMLHYKRKTLWTRICGLFLAEEGRE
ncbi:Uncharacterized protein XB16_1359 [Leptospira santarosai]|uniref:Uncharacterized protein n=1 Tax=Leptospira santarosai TaxID=28183 RepID=A0A2P1QS21_9LEPT|nr:Uncharacterized protein XB16_1359 [Leptospira santarosai]